MTLLGPFLNSVMVQGASTVKYTSLLPCIDSSESDSKRYTNFEIYEGKNHTNLERKNIDLQSQAIYVDKKSSKNNLLNLEDGASSVQVDILSTHFPRPLRKTW